ncbi:MlaD family protein [Haliangium sp.]|uniref:MlaD family protein n=1 Tax=Haliangium sp. TaxID=2663208 RepID=UPI003D0EDC21
MRTRGIEYKVGILIVVAAVTLIGFIGVLGNFALGGGYTLYVDFDFSGNIQPGAPVRVSGIKLGRVDDVVFMGGQLDETETRRVQVRLEVWLRDEARDAVRRDAEFYINTQGVLGEQYLEIVPGDDYDQPPIEPNTIHVGNSPPRMDLLLSRLFTVLESVSDVLREDKDVIRNLLANSASAVDQVNTLLTDNREHIGSLLAGADGLTREATQTLRQVNEGLGDPRIIGRTVRHADALLINADQSLTTLTPKVQTLLDDATRATGLLTEDRVDRAIDVADKAADAAGKAGGLIDNVDGMVTDLRAGKGTAGALLVSEEVYADLREMIRDLKRNPWKFFWKE